MNIQYSGYIYQNAPVYVHWRTLLSMRLYISYKQCHDVIPRSKHWLSTYMRHGTDFS